MSKLNKLAAVILSAIILCTTTTHAQIAAKGARPAGSKEQPFTMQEYKERYIEDKKVVQAAIGNHELFVLGGYAFISLFAFYVAITYGQQERKYWQYKIARGNNNMPKKTTWTYREFDWQYSKRAAKLYENSYLLQTYLKNKNETELYEAITKKRVDWAHRTSSNGLSPSSFKNILQQTELELNMKAIAGNPNLVSEYKTLTALSAQPYKNILMEKEAVYMALEKKNISPVRVVEDIILDGIKYPEEKVLAAQSLKKMRDVAFKGDYAAFKNVLKAERKTINLLSPKNAKILKSLGVLGAFMVLSDAIAAQDNGAKHAAKVLENIDLIATADSTALEAIEANADAAALIKEALDIFHMIAQGGDEVQEAFATDIESKAKEIKFDTANNTKHSSYGVRTGR
ncbi:hypothetical protein AAIR98_001237 [Elusimicrobium simillimum]|uniref:hypothetical protein n=1 Tax=Elusimicrobium simillimum TaxID=3143438 RepID=UPI003C6F2209